MDTLCTEIGYVSLNKYGEELCGDHIEIVKQSDKSTVMVLADGLGSGVKANILSTLTSKIISTMMAADLSIEDCVNTIAGTLPICSVRQIAYSTFTIIRITEDYYAEIIQFDNPHVMLLRGGKNYIYQSEAEIIEEKVIYKSRIQMREGDMLVAVSDGAIHAGIGVSLNHGWERKNIIDFLETIFHADHNARNVSQLLANKCYQLYGGRPGDDTSVLTLKVRTRKIVNLMLGPPRNQEDDEAVLSEFFGLAGQHIVCGGTTAQMVGRYLDKEVEPVLPLYVDPEIPPMAQIEGVDLVTEGVITMSYVLKYAEDFLTENKEGVKWAYQQDAASRIARLLFEEATDINFYVGRAVNPAHQNPSLPINFNIKMRLVDELAECLKQMNKNIKVNYY